MKNKHSKYKTIGSVESVVPKDDSRNKYVPSINN